MAPYDDWNTLEEEDEDELQDPSMFETKRDVILFCIDCSESMLEPYDDHKYEDTVKTCHLYTALEAAMQIQKKKIIIGPNDSVGIMLFNTTRKSDANKNQGSEIKKGTYLLQPISPLSAPKVQELMKLLNAAREDLDELRKEFPPLTTGRVPMGDVFTSCNWVIRDGAPKTASKRVFLITDEDDPHPSVGNKQLAISARTTLVDLTQAGVTVEPFFIDTGEKGFNPSKFYSSVLLPTDLEDDEGLQKDDSLLPDSISISRIEDLLSQMRLHEVPKRAQFSIPFHLAKGFTIGIKGYGLVTEQKKGSYKYFADVDNELKPAISRTIYTAEGSQEEVDKARIMYGADVGTGTAIAEGGAANDDDEDNDEDIAGGFGARVVKAGQRPVYTAEEIRAFRTLGLEPGIKLLGFKDRAELHLEDNVKHSQFIYPDEMSYSGSKRTFSALLKSMIKKDKIALALCLTRRNASPIFCALLPQEEKGDTFDLDDPAGFHLIQLPFADDIRAATVEHGTRASEEMKNSALAWIDKLTMKKGTYDPDSFPNPALAYHNEQLQATAFEEDYDPDSFEDLTVPKFEAMHKRAGKLMKNWKLTLAQDPSTEVVIAATGSKRKADVAVSEEELRSLYDNGYLAKLRVDQLKDFLKSKGLSASGRKADLTDRVAEWFGSH
ncbi:ATP-dependent DNA helicase II subunit 1 [Psilocybe cubensis]|uniref:ATP-dependent DNA helicase II subunit 1 n=2 Tax=Psilocybe cubensis TaxID=181762 RepID=A0A8H7XKS8_PSICU|nr:ATP-dependent DNA helicase II subunit 1 [Psilocybe cubensis]KAH9481902.1 ATP-dependent DNA helicase II subunit 1 [Psilocybe cubensis]